MPNKPQRETIGAEEAAQLIGISRRSVNALYNAGKLEGYKVGEGLTSRIQFYRDSVVAYVKRVQHRSIA